MQAPFAYSIARYRSGSRFVVIATATTTAGAEVVFGPDTREACDEYIARNPAK